MSYEPILIIDKKDLSSKMREINERKIDLHNARSEKKKKQYIALTEIEGYDNCTAVDFHNETVVIVHPELTSHNKLIRATLELLNIYYVEYN